MRVLLVCLIVAAVSVNTAPQQSPLPPAATAAEVATYEAFRAWVTKQPPASLTDEETVYRLYAAELKSQGQAEREITATFLDPEPDHSVPPGKLN
jgi:hypothetical protein